MGLMSTLLLAFQTSGLIISLAGAEVGSVDSPMTGRFEIREIQIEEGRFPSADSVVFESAVTESDVHYLPDWPTTYKVYPTGRPTRSKDGSFVQTMALAGRFPLARSTVQGTFTLQLEVRVYMNEKVVTSRAVSRKFDLSY